MSLDFSDFLSALDDSPFEEDPVDLDTFLHDPQYLDQPELSQIQRDLVEAMSQIYKEEDLVRIMGEEAGRKHYKKYTKAEVLLQLGKGCHAGSDEVFDSESGQWKRIDSLQGSPDNFVLGSNDGNIVSQYSTESFCLGLENTFEVEIERGLSVTVSENHSFYNESFERVALKDLKQGDRIAVTTKTNISRPVRIDDREVALLGYWLGDGTMPMDKPRRRNLNMDFGDSDESAMEEYLNILKSFGDDPYIKHHPNGKKMSFVRSGIDSSAVAISQRHGLWGKRAHDKEIPEAVWSLPDDQLAIFISRLWGTDGCVYMKKSGKKVAPVLEYCTVSEKMAVGIQRLLTRFGVLASLRSRRPTYTYDGEKRQGQETFYLTISDKTGFERFAKAITLLDKQDKIDEGMEILSSRQSQSPYIDDFYMARIKSIKEVMPQPVFTMTAVDTHNFVANLVLNGNSGK
jgi:hypothetical protein